VRQQSVSNVVLEIFEVQSLPLNGFFKRLHGGQLVVGADRIKSFDQLRLDTDSHVLGALDQE